MSAVWEGLTPPYRTIVADPPWSYRQTRFVSRTGHHNKAAEDKYSTLTNSEIAGLSIGELADSDAHLYLWVTNPRLFGGHGDDLGPIDMIRDWGFTYVTMLTWLKTGTLGMGFYFRGDTEHVIFATRGKAPIPADKRERNWFQAPKRGHSVKPPEFFDLVERVSPPPYVELFARSPRLGWDSWGYGWEQAS